MLAPDELDNDPKRLIDHIYGSFDVAANRQDSHLIERAILAPRNKDVDALNAHAVASFPGEEFVYSSADRVADETQAHMFPPEYLHTGGLAVRDGEIDDLMPAKYIQAH
jgi:hypothetical protein